MGEPPLPYAVITLYDFELALRRNDFKTFYRYCRQNLDCPREAWHLLTDWAEKNAKKKLGRPPVDLVHRAAKMPGFGERWMAAGLQNKGAKMLPRRSVAVRAKSPIHSRAHDGGVANNSTLYCRTNSFLAHQLGGKALPP